MERTRYLFGGSFNPPGVHHKGIVRALHSMLDLARGDRLYVIPCGGRPDKTVVDDTEAIHRAAMCELAFRGMNLPGLELDLSDMEKDTFTRTWELDARYRAQFPGDQIVHIVGYDLVRGSGSGASEMLTWHRVNELLANAHFLLIQRDGEIDQTDLPPHCAIAKFVFSGSSKEIRARANAHSPIDHLVDRQVARYIERHFLYTGRAIYGPSQVKLAGSAMVIADNDRERSSALAAIVDRVYASRSGLPDHVIVVGGDGFMLDQINTLGHLRLPLLGLNAGTLGFLLNEGNDAQIQERLERGIVRVYHQRLLRVTGKTQDSEPFQTHAFNEAFVRTSTEQNGRIIVSIDGVTRFDPLNADGLMISTAAGSTGWARAKGATPILIGTPSILLTGDGATSSHGRFVSAPLSINSTVEINLLDAHKRPMHLVVDGRRVNSVASISVSVSRSQAVELAFFPQTDLSEKHMRLHFPS